MNYNNGNGNGATFASNEKKKLVAQFLRENYRSSESLKVRVDLLLDTIAKTCSERKYGALFDLFRELWVLDHHFGERIQKIYEGDKVAKPAPKPPTKTVINTPQKPIFNAPLFSMTPAPAPQPEPPVCKPKPAVSQPPAPKPEPAKKPEPVDQGPAPELPRRDISNELWNTVRGPGGRALKRVAEYDLFPRYFAEEKKTKFRLYDFTFWFSTKYPGVFADLLSFWFLPQELEERSLSDKISLLNRYLGASAIHQWTDPGNPQYKGLVKISRGLYEFVPGWGPNGKEAADG